MRSTASKIRPWSVEVTGQCYYHGKSVGFYSGVRQGGEAARRQNGICRCHRPTRITILRCGSVVFRECQQSARDLEIGSSRVRRANQYSDGYKNRVLDVPCRGPYLT